MSGGFSLVKEDIRNADYSNNPQLKETNKINDLLLKNFNKNKETWK